MQEEINEAGINVQKILLATIKRTNHMRLMQNLIVFLTLSSTQNYHKAINESNNSLLFHHFIQYFFCAIRDREWSN